MSQANRNVEPGLFCLRGAIELHSEALSLNFLQLARAVGLRDVVIKWPGGPDSAPIAEFANATQTHGPKFWGGVVLDRTVGGINSAAVAASGERGGRFAWMPTVDALHHRRINGLREDNAVHLLDEDGYLLDSVHEVLKAAADHDMIIGTGHIGSTEIERVVEAALGYGVPKVLLNHPLLLGFSIDFIKRITAHPEVFIEHCYVPNHEKYFDVGLIVQAIDAINPRQSVIADFGVFEQDANIADALVAYGVDPTAIERLTVENPAQILALH